MWICLAIGQHAFVWLNPSCEKGLSAGSIFQRPLCLRFKYEYHLRKTFGKQCSVDCFYRLLELSALKDEIYQRNKTPIYFSIWFVRCAMCDVRCAMCDETVHNKCDRSDMIRTKTVFFFHFFSFMLLNCVSLMQWTPTLVSHTFALRVYNKWN